MREKKRDGRKVGKDGGRKTGNREKGRWREREGDKLIIQEENKGRKEVERGKPGRKRKGKGRKGIQVCERGGNKVEG